MFWNRYPFARILFPFLTGIIIALYFDLNFQLPFLALAFPALALFIIVVFFQKKLTYRMRWLTGFIFTLFFLLAGYQLTAMKNNKNNNFFFGPYLADENYVLARMNEPVQVREKVCKCVVEVISVRDSIRWTPALGKAILYIEKDSFSENLNYGDEIIFKGKLSEVAPPMNPGEYNYKNYLKYRSVEYNGYVKKNAWRLLSSCNGNILMDFAYKLRGKLLRILNDNGLQGDEYAVVSALLIGYTDNLDPELIKNYQGTGAVHILSVSGLHVGVIFVVLNFLLQFFDRNKYGRLPKAFLLLGFIWFYAVLTGMSPSVMRATAMFSLIIIGKAFRYPPNIYNTVAASAFVLLMADPYMITAVGFQLSYLAVLGIVAIYPHINKAWIPKYWLLRQLWSLIAVSISAQLITFPLCLYYFHQFPNYFLLTNIIAVPLSGLVIYLGIAVLVLSFLPWFSLLLAKALSFSLMLLNGSVSFIENLPYSVTRAIPLSFTELLLVYAVSIGLCIYILKRNHKVFIGVAAFALILLIPLTASNYNALSQKKIVVYNVNKHTVVDFIYGKSVWFLCDPAFIADTRKQDFHIMNNRCEHKIRHVTPVITGSEKDAYRSDCFFRNGNFIGFAGKKLALIDKATYNTRRLALDFLLISQNPDISMGEILQQYKPTLIIFDASNSVKNIKKWTAQCNLSRVSYYSTRTSGAWVYNLNEQ
ncbi:MAG TPA: ComEC/Rec2 family competence protein [Bacteroidales bacterium]|nr:ComEC/Rec2 family competence protein [Bacteroidales bacterium]